MIAPCRPPTRRAALAMIGAAALMPRMAVAGGLESLSGRAFGTHWRIVGPPGQGIARLGRAIDALFEQVDRQFSPYRQDSAISRFNAGVPGAATSGPAFVEVTTAALEIARQSAGAFDPTVGPLVARWGFGPIRSGGAPDWRGVSAEATGLSRTREDLTLDLCGIAKGWALDRAADLARGAGCTDLLLDLGGEFAALGQHPDGRAWRVGIEAPITTRDAQTALRVPAGVAVATSGTRAQSFRLDGRLYSHIIDPGTGRPAAGPARSVTVVAQDAMTADGWATALLAAGDEAGPALAASRDIAALFLIERRGKLRQVRTGPIAGMIL